VVNNAAIAGKARMDGMRAFFEGVGTGDTAGIWEGRRTCAPISARPPEEARQAKAAKAEEMI
jgi:3,8-divinyl chlorophyllide a/chlorophyllide a reductase subunit Y